MMKQNNVDIFYKKYITYKNKYLNLKNQLGGVICPPGTLNMKLNVDNERDCNNVNARGTVKIPDLSAEEKAAANRKGYKTDNLKYNCYSKEGNTGNIETYNFINPSIINGPFKVATYNIMGIDNTPEKIELIKIRAPLISKEIIDNDIDIVCFQEMSYTSYIELRILLPNYDIYDFINEGETNFFRSQSRGHDIECAVALKKGITPKRIIIEPLGGNITYTNSLMIIEFPNLVIFNCYLQAGTKFSPGLSKIYLHYSRCRQQLLQFIIDKLQNYKYKHHIILGDFNIDLNSSIDTFPDIQYINKIKNLGFIDNWKEFISKEKGKVLPLEISLDELGLTEDSDTNIMRWNDKFKEKQSRVDGIFTRDIELIDSKIIGIKYLLIPRQSPYKNEFIRHFTAAGENYNDPRLKKISKKIPIFASDHYGVVSTLRII